MILRRKASLLTSIKFICQNCKWFILQEYITRHIDTISSVSHSQRQNADVFVQMAKVLILKCICRNCRKTKQQHNFFWLPYSLAETKIVISSPVLSHNLSVILSPSQIHMLYSKDLTLSMCHFSSTFLHRVFSNVFANCLPQKRHSHIGCICLTFLHCVFSNVSSNCLPEKRHSHIGCIC